MQDERSYPYMSHPVLDNHRFHHHNHHQTREEGSQNDKLAEHKYNSPTVKWYAFGKHSCLYS